DALDRVGEDLGVELFEDRCALELAHRVLVVVEDDDVHGKRQMAAALVSGREPIVHGSRAPGSMVDSNPIQETSWRSRCTRPACRSSCACSATSTAGSTRPRPMP